MRTREDIEAYLLRSGHPHREIADGTWLVGDAYGSRENIVLRIGDAQCHLRMKVLDLSAIDPAKSRDFYLALLELNASDLVYGAYAVADGMVLLVATLPLESLDYNELVGAIEDFLLAMANHHARIAEYHRPTAERPNA